MIVVTSMQRVCAIGEIAGYVVAIVEDTIIVVKNGKEIGREEVPGLAWYLSVAGDLRLGWANLPDLEVVYLFDNHNNGFGYAVSLGNPYCSEWGVNPFYAEGT